MSFKKIFLVSDNQILMFWCTTELCSEWILKNIDVKTFDSEVFSGKESDYFKGCCCVLFDFDCISEIQFRGTYSYFQNKYLFPSVILYDSGINLTAVKRKVSADYYINVYGVKGKLKEAINSAIESNGKSKIKPDSYFPKPLTVPVQLKRSISSGQLTLFDSLDADENEFTIIKSKSQKMIVFREQIKKASLCNDIVLLTGESGSGKSFTAKYIHTHSSFYEKELVKISLPDLVPSLAEGMLFGVSKGSYTNAVESEGIIVSADGTTLFMDEIGEISPGLQTKLLSVIETRKVRKIGSSVEKKINTRFIFATNSDLKKKVKKGSFRKDLYFRISVLSIEVPALREHPEDIPALAKEFAGKFGRKISKQSIEKLCSYNWPGNIRELKNVIKRASVFFSEKVIKPEQIQFD